MNVVVQPGAAYAQAALDTTAYSSLAADSFVTQKQGIIKTSMTFSTPAPTTAGQSINYLISAAFVEGDTNLTVLPYYNAANPSQAFAGPNNTGASQATTRQCTIQLTLTAGTPATTGSQTTPATPNGQSALYVVTVAYGATTVVASNIKTVSGAPFINFGSVLGQIGNFKGMLPLSSATTLTMAQSGSFVELAGASAFATTLPAPSTANLRFTFYNAATVACSIVTPSGVIYNSNLSAALISVPAAASLDMVSDGVNWIVLSGGGAASLSASGYQKLSSGLIIQWGSLSAAAGTSTAIAFPIAFNSAVYSVVVTPLQNSGTVGLGTNTIALANFNVWNGGTSALGGYWYAVGK
jgi:hypothetical protein